MNSITSKQTCEACGEPFEITPTPADMTAWRNCLSPECPSYDPARDLDGGVPTDTGCDVAWRTCPGCGVCVAETYFAAHEQACPAAGAGA